MGGIKEYLEIYRKIRSLKMSPHIPNSAFILFGVTMPKKACISRVTFLYQMHLKLFRAVDT